MNKNTLNKYISHNIHMRKKIESIKMFSNISIQTKASLWYAVSNFLQKGISFITIPFYTRLLSTSEYGEWSVFQSWRDLLIIFGTLYLFGDFYSKSLVDYNKDRDRFTSSMQGLGTVVSIGMLLLYLLTSKITNRILNMDTPYVLLLFLYFIFSPSLSYWSAKQRVEYNYKEMVFVSLLVTVLTQTISVILLYNTDLRAKALILGNLIVQCSFGLFFYIHFFIRGRCFYDGVYWKKALTYNLPLIPHYVSIIALGQSDRIMISHFCGEAEAGIYTFSYQLGSAITIFVNSIDNSRIPWTFERLKEKKYEKIKETSNVLVVMMASITFSVILIAPEIISIMAPDSFYEANHIFPTIVLGVYFYFCYNLYSTIEFYFGTTKYVTNASLFSSVVNVLLNLLLLPKYGYFAAGYTTLICYIILMLMHIYYSNKTLKENNITIKIYNNTFIVLISVLLFIVCQVLSFGYGNLVVRAFILLVVLSIVIVYRKKIKNALFNNEEL